MGIELATLALIGAGTATAATAIQGADSARKARNATKDAQLLAQQETEKARVADSQLKQKTEIDGAVAAQTRSAFAKRALKANSLLTGAGESAAQATRTTLGV